MVLLQADIDSLPDLIGVVRAQSFPTTIPTDAPFDTATYSEVLRMMDEKAARNEKPGAARKENFGYHLQHALLFELPRGFPPCRRLRQNFSQCVLSRSRLGILRFVRRAQFFPRHFSKARRHYRSIESF